MGTAHWLKRAIDLSPPHITQPASRLMVVAVSHTGMFHDELNASAMVLLCTEL